MKFHAAAQNLIILANRGRPLRQEHLAANCAYLSVSLREGASQQRVKDDDGFIEIPDEDAFVLGSAGAWRRVLQASAATGLALLAGRTA